MHSIKEAVFVLEQAPDTKNSAAPGPLPWFWNSWIRHWWLSFVQIFTLWRERERDAKHTFTESGHYFELPLHHISVLIKNWISRKIIDSCHFQEILGLRIYYKYTGILRKIIAFCYQNELYLTTLQIIINKRKYICAIDIYTYMHRHVYYHIVDYLEVLILYSNMHYIFRLLKLP